MEEQVKIKVEAIEGELGRYRVQSKTDPENPHLVDLLEYQGNGECSCPDFYFDKRGNLKAGQTPQTKHTMCRHIMIARTKWANDSLKYCSAEKNTRPKR